MKRVGKITCWTDYPFDADGVPRQAPVRHVQVIDYDGDKYVTVGIIGQQPKVGDKVYFHPKVFTDRHYKPYYDDYKGKWFKVIELHIDEEDGEYSGHLRLGEMVWNPLAQGYYDIIPLESMVHDDEVMVAESVKKGYMYSKRGRYGQVPVVNGDKIRRAFGHDPLARYYAKRGIKVRRDRWGFTFL